MEHDAPHHGRQCGTVGLPLLSVIIVNYNTRELLENCLDSVFSTVGDLDIQVIVSDNGSTDGSLPMCKDRFPDVQIIDNGLNLGFGAANNVAKSFARGRFILFLNSDTIVKERAFQKSIEFLLEHPNVGALGCRLIQADGNVQLSVAPFTSLSLSLMARASKNFLTFQNPEFYEKDCLSVDYVAGAYLMVKADVLETCGWFDEQFFMYAEEMDLCFRIREAGYSVAYFAGSEIVHLGGMSSRGSNRSEIWRTISKLRFIRKHHSSLYFQLFKLLSLSLVGWRRLGGNMDSDFYKSQIKAHQMLDYGVKDLVS